MLLGERYLIAPTSDELVAGLQELFAAHTRGTDVNRWRNDPNLFPALLAEVGAGREGDTRWDVVFQEAALLTLRVIWVSDHGSRRHFRAQLWRRHRDGNGQPITPLRDEGKSPAELVYARHAYQFVSEPNASPRLVMGCPCGVLGTVEEIAWMGDCCGPCHDRRESGEPLPLPLVRHERVPLHPVTGLIPGRTLAVLPDGENALILRNRTADEEGPVGPVLTLWNLTDQRTRLMWTLTQRNIGVNLNPDGSALGIIYPGDRGVHLSIFDWPGPGHGEAAAARCECEIPGEPRCFTLAPGATTAYMGNLREIVAVDITRNPPEYHTWVTLADEPNDLACTADGRWLAVFWHQSGLMLFDRATREARVRYPIVSSRGVLAFTPDSRHLFACDAEAAIWIFEVPTLRLVGRFRGRSWTVNGLDVCGPWLMLEGLVAEPIECWPWEVLEEYARTSSRPRS